MECRWLKPKEVRVILNYQDDDYKFYYYRMIDSLGNYLCNLPPNLKRRVLFVQSAEGSTGDEGWYKSDPTDPQYEITHEQWNISD